MSAAHDPLAPTATAARAKAVAAPRDAARPGLALAGALPIGAHLITRRRGYTHHGIHVGGNKVVHYAGLSRSFLRGPVEEVSLARFAGGREVFVRPRAAGKFRPDEVVARARSRLGEDRYRLTTNNCEHFCEWCLSGKSRSEQVEQHLGRLREVLVAARRVLGFVCGAGLRARPQPDIC